MNQQYQSVQSQIENKEEAHIFCLSVKTWPKWAIFLVGTLGVFGSFLLFGIAHEELIERFKINETFFLTFFQFVGYSAFSLPTFFEILSKKYTLKAPLYLYVVNSISICFLMGLVNFATLRINYATSVLFKSSKLIPVMIGNIFFLQKAPKFTEFIAVMLIVLGLIGVSYGDYPGDSKFDIIGIASISLSLLSGAVASNLEDKIMSVYGASQDELVSMLYMIGALIMLALSLVTGELIIGLEHIFDDYSSLLFLAVFGFLGAIGIQFVYLIMKVFGSLTTVMVTSVRKAFTVVLSFIMFRDKEFSLWHAVSIVLVVAGMVLGMYEKLSNDKNRRQKDGLKKLLNNQEEVNDNPANFKLVLSGSE